MNRIQANLPRLNLQFDTVSRYLDNLKHNFLALRRYPSHQNIEIAITSGRNNQLSPNQFRQYFYRLGLNGNYDPNTGILVVKRHGKDGTQKKPKQSESIQLEVDPIKLSRLQEVTGSISELYGRYKHKVGNFMHTNVDPKTAITAQQSTLGDIDNLFLSPFQPFTNHQQSLPIHKHKTQIIESINNHQSLVISGSTGSGKSTQVPQYLIENHKKLNMTRAIVVQPRRISATSLARRVSEELGDPLGNIVGYQVKNDSKVSEKTRLFFATTGVLLRRLITSPDLDEFSHVIIDEIHERNTQVDLALSAIKLIMLRRPNLKLIVMSATLDVNLFQNYLQSVDVAYPVKVQGRSFPVKLYHLEHILNQLKLPIDPTLLTSPKKVQSCEANDNFGQRKPKIKYDPTTFTKAFNSMLQTYPDVDREVCQSLAHLSKCFDSGRDKPMLEYEAVIIHQLINYIIRHMWHSNKGSILVFLPGWSEILNIKNRLESDGFIEQVNAKILTLHSRLSIEEQNKVFDHSSNQVKIILSTNVAETDDVVYVIDVGKVRESGYDTTNDIDTLVIKTYNQASALQRQGRAGRVMPGHCFRLFPSHYFDCLPTNSIPEIRRSNLQQLVLEVISICQNSTSNRTFYQFLNEMVDPPPKPAIDVAVRKLLFLNIIESSPTTRDDYRLTEIGKRLSQLPLPVADSKMLAFAAMTDCLDPALTQTALQDTNLFQQPANPDIAYNQRQLRKQLGQNIYSDLIVDVRAYYLAQQRHFNYQFCNLHAISRPALLWISKTKQHLMANLPQLGFPLPQLATEYKTKFDGAGKDPFNNQELIVRFKAALTACQTFNLARLNNPNSKPKKNVGKLRLLDGIKATLPEDTTIASSWNSNKFDKVRGIWFLYTRLFALSETENKLPELNSPSVIDSLTLLLFYTGKVTVASTGSSEVSNHYRTATPPLENQFKSQLELLNYFNNPTPPTPPETTRSSNGDAADKIDMGKPGKLLLEIHREVVVFNTENQQVANSILEVRKCINILLEMFIAAEDLDFKKRKEFFKIKDIFFNRLFELLRN